MVAILKREASKRGRIVAEKKNINESFHRKCGQRQDLHFNLICRLSRKSIPVASISLLFICTDCQRDFVRNSSSPYDSNERNLHLRGSITQRKQLSLMLSANSLSLVEIYRLNQNKFVFKWLMFPNGALLNSFCVENAMVPGNNLKCASPTTEAIPYT